MFAKARSCSEITSRTSRQIFFVGCNIVVYRMSHNVTGKKKGYCIFVVFFMLIFIIGCLRKRYIFGRFIYDLRSSTAGSKEQGEKKGEDKNDGFQISYHTISGGVTGA